MSGLSALARDNPRCARLTISISAIAVILVCVIRYCQAPSFWLDEAFVAVSLRNPTPETIFAPLDYSQYFPRIYLAAIALLRVLFGYQIWVLRLLPALSFITATVLWARLLAKRAGSFVALSVLSAALLVGGSFWLAQSIQLKQYTLDVLVALIPFTLGDQFFTETMAEGKRKSRLMLLAIPCFVSYTYPVAIIARVIGWYAHRGRHRGWRVSAPAVCTLIISVAFGLVSIWLTDYRFDLRSDKYLTYWNASILSSRFRESIGSGLGLIANFVWGWHHGRLMPLVITAVAPLQALGVYRVVSRWKHRDAGWDDDWGSRTLGSLALLTGIILASVLLAYPISAGRLVLFSQIHTQILAIEGALFILSFRSKHRAAVVFLCAAIGIVIVYSTHRYVDIIRTEPSENIRPMLSLIKPELANTVLVHPCSVVQVASLPDKLPVERVLMQNRMDLPQPGQRAWVLWTNMSAYYCREWMDQTRSSALSWQVVHEGPGRGLALAEF